MSQAWLTFVIIGAGATGVELAGAFAEVANDTLRHDFHRINPGEAQILLVDAAPRVLPTFPEDLSLAAEKALIRLGVRSRMGVPVASIDESGVLFRNNERILAKTVIWAAGVRASDFGQVLEQELRARLDATGRVHVAPDLTIAGHPEIFVLGDLARCMEGGSPLPGIAPVAMQQGRYAANVVRQRLENHTPPPFRYVDKGNLAVIGRQAGVGVVGGVHVRGWLAWLLWLSVHLFYLAQFRNRLFVFLRWGFQFLTFDRGARLIK